MVKSDNNTSYKDTLDRYHEGDSIAVASGDPLTPGTSEIIYTIPDGEAWSLEEFGGSSSVDFCEVELLYSDDGGSTWKHPIDTSANKIRCIHLHAGGLGIITFQNLIQVIGSGTDIKIKLLCKNWNQTETAEIAVWLNGWIE